MLVPLGPIHVRSHFLMLRHQLNDSNMLQYERPAALSWNAFYKHFYVRNTKPCFVHQLWHLILLSCVDASAD